MFLIPSPFDSCLPFITLHRSGKTESIHPTGSVFDETEQSSSNLITQERKPLSLSYFVPGISVTRLRCYFIKDSGDNGTESHQEYQRESKYQGVHSTVNVITNKIGCFSSFENSL